MKVCSSIAAFTMLMFMLFISAEELVAAVVAEDDVAKFELSFGKF